MDTNMLTRKDVENICSTIGIGLFIMAIISMVVQGLVEYFLDIKFPNINHMLKFIISNAIGFYIIGVFVFRHITEKIETEKISKTKSYSFFEMIELAILSLGTIILFSIIGAIIISFIGIKDVSPFESWIRETGGDGIGLLFIAICILAPIFEELIFRGWILKKLRVIGTKWAIFISALLFGMYHMNIVQGIYAFGVGLVFACVTIRSGSIKNSIILHGIINFVGGIIIPMLFGTFSYLIIPYGQTIAITFIIWALVCGTIIFYKNGRELLVTDEMKYNIQEHTNFSTVNLNVGMILFYMLTITVTILNVV
ncbi:MAG: lysostaphin resistance A-like protein [Filifactoraceae bacterium]